MRANEPVNKLLIKKAEQIRTGAEMLISKTRDFQVIQEYIKNRIDEIKLTPDQQKKLDRYQYIYNQLVSGKYTDQEIINQVMKMHNIKIVQAYEDMNCSRELFNSVFNINKRFELNLQLQINRDMLRKAAELNDVLGFARLEKNRVSLLAELPDEEENPADLFEGHIIEPTFDPKLLGAPPVDMKEVMKAINEKRNVKIKTDMFEELLAEEIKDEQEDPL